jgi:hypothetical protein
VSLSNHAFAEFFSNGKQPPRAWFDKLTTNGFFTRI